MSIKKYISVIFATITFTTISQATVYTGPNRIIDDTEKKARCMGKGIGSESCEKRRLTALNQGCISKEEYEKLKSFGSFPSCTYLEDEKIWDLTAWCRCGCFHPDTLISTQRHGKIVQTPARDLINQLSTPLLHLASDATLSNMKKTSTPILFSTLGPEEKELVVIETTDGIVLKVTDRHPILTAAGMMVIAKDISLQDVLIDLDGNLHFIKELRGEKYDGDVINFMINKTLDQKNEHVIFANELAVGDLAWQASLEDELNQVFIRQ